MLEMVGMNTSVVVNWWQASIELWWSLRASDLNVTFQVNVDSPNRE